LRDAAPDVGSSELLNIFIQEADDLFDVPATGRRRRGRAGECAVLAGPAGVRHKERLQGLWRVRARDVLRRHWPARLAGAHHHDRSEHQDATLRSFTLVTASYRSDRSPESSALGPTRMPYDRIVALVVSRVRLVVKLLE